MLTIFVSDRELYDETTEEFVLQPSFVLRLEHSLVSLSKWESKFEKAFLGKEAKTNEELRGYIECMIQDGPTDQESLSRLTSRHFDEIRDYIESAQTATKFGELPKKTTKAETVTAELIYFWLVTFNIPFEVETWHLNRLFALVRICNMKNQKPTRKSKAEMTRQYREMNARRRAELGTRG